jgi:hypothetical protein
MLRARLLALLATLILVVAMAGCGGARVTTGAPSTATSLSPSTSGTAQSSTTSTVASAAGREHIVYAVGDSPLPGNETHSSAIARLVPLPADGLELFLYLGDVYLSGSPADFAHYDSIFGGGGRDLRAKTASVIGNHESVSREEGWVPYWSGTLITPWPGSLTRTNPPYYTIKLGQWKFILLDTNRQVSVGSAQYDFLVKELKEPGYHCIVAGHSPRWSSGLHGNDSSLAGFWKQMCDNGAVAYVSGHDHNSQIQPARDAGGRVVSVGGCTQIVAGGGGGGHYKFGSGSGDSAPEWGDDTHYAVLRLTLRDRDFTADFIAEDRTLLHSQTFPVGAIPGPAA